MIRTFQTVRLFETMTVFENILVAADVRAPVPEERLLGHRSREARSAAARADAVIEKMEIAPLRDSRVTELAYGTRRRVELARALVMHPRLLLLDEPAAGLNGAERADLGARLRELRGQGLTVILVEHQMDLVSAVCDELTVLDFGRVLCEGPPADVVEDERVLEANLGAAGGRL